MKTFDDLKFSPPCVDRLGNVQATEDFPNGYGVSVVRGPYTYGGDRGLYELAVIRDGSLCYDTSVTDDVLGHLTPGDVTEAMRKVQELESRIPSASEAAG